jgi:hypothetical protein
MRLEQKQWYEQWLFLRIFEPGCRSSGERGRKKNGCFAALPAAITAAAITDDTAGILTNVSRVSHIAFRNIIDDTVSTILLNVSH